MTGLFNTMNTATSGLRGQQTALQTVGHNLANSNTEGYSRQRVTMAASIPHTAAGIGHIGTGVDISGITRITDDYVNGQLRDGNSTLERYQTTSEMLGQLELIYNEPSDSGLAMQLTEVFNAWNYLAANPELATAKTMVVRQSETFVSTINHMANQMDTLAADVERQIEKQLEDFNSLTRQLVDTNNQIFEASVQGHRPNDLLDQQDRILADLNNIVGVKIERQDHNRVTVTLGNEEVVSVNDVKKIEYDNTNTNPNKPMFKIDAREVEIKNIDRGSIKGLQVSLDVIDSKKADLDQFALVFANAINKLHRAEGADPDPNTDFFVRTNDSGDAVDPTDYTDLSRTLRVNETYTKASTEINAGAAEKAEDSIAGDGSRAKAIADLQSKPVGDSTLFTKFNNMVTDMGIEKQQADNMAANQTDLVALLDQRRESISGVDINEEVVNMIQYQSGFQANARMISVISEMLDTLINRTGV